MSTFSIRLTLGASRATKAGDAVVANTGACREQGIMEQGEDERRKTQTNMREWTLKGCCETRNGLAPNQRHGSVSRLASRMTNQNGESILTH